MAWGVGLELAAPMGTFGDVANMGFGGTGRFEYQLQNNLALTATVGYLAWGGKEVTIQTSTGIFGSTVKSTIDYSSIPIKAGIKYYFSGGFYGMGEAGIHMFSTDVKTVSTVTSASGTKVTEEPGTGSSTEFTIAPAVGYELKAGNMIVDLSARYEIISDLSFLGFRAGLKFAL